MWACGACDGKGTVVIYVNGVPKTVPCTDCQKPW